MTKAIIHIGMDKAGSTSIQQSLAGYDNTLAIYPEIDGKPNHSDHLIALFQSDSRRRRTNAHRQAYGKPARNLDVEFHRKAALQAIESAQGRTVVLSSEGVYFSLDRAELAAMKTFLDQYFVDYRLVAYVRPPETYLSSRFQLKVKSSRLASFDIGKCYPDYRQGFEKFDDVFGKEKILLWKFDPAKFHEGDVVADFCYRLKLPKPRNIKRSNASLSRPIVSLIYSFNRSFQEGDDPAAHQAVTRAIVNQCKDPSWPSFRFAPEVVAPVIARHADDISWMSNRLGESFSLPMRSAETDVRTEADLLASNRSLLPKLEPLQKNRRLSPEVIDRLRDIIEGGSNCVRSSLQTAS